MTIGTTYYHEKRQKELNEHLKKATNEQQVAPKRKHVRWVILFAWDHVKSMSGSSSLPNPSSFSTQPIWSALKDQPILANEIMCFKALILIHCLLVEGPQMLLTDAVREIPFLDECARRFHTNGFAGYTALIRPYVQYLKAKIDFHRLYPLFNGLFDFEEYMKNKTIDNLDEAYQTITDLSSLMNHLNQLSCSIINQFRGYAEANECRQAALIPLVLESHGMYKFMTNLLSVLLEKVESIEALIPLQQCYEDSFQNLRAFYSEARKMKYLSSIIVVPELPNRAPFRFEEKKKLAPTSRPSSTSDLAVTKAKDTFPREAPKPLVEELLIDFDGPSDQDIYCNFQAQEEPDMYYGSAETIQPPMAIMDAPSLQPNSGQMIAGIIEPLNHEIMFWRSKYEDLERAYSQLNMSVQANQAHMSNMLEPLNNEVAFWKQKYEEMANLYQSLRMEHTELLRRYELLQAQHSSCQASTNDSLKLQKEIQELNAHLKNLAKQNELLRRNESKMLEEYQREKVRLEKEIMDLKASLKRFAHEEEDRKRKEDLLRFKLEQEAQERAAQERAQRERLERERLERERQELGRLEKERLERERMEKEMLERERLERERIERERLERERLERERLERERLERERLAALERQNAEDDLARKVQNEMKSAEASVSDALSRMNQLRQRLIHEEDTIWLESSLRITDAVSLLIKYAIQCQTEIVYHGRGAGNPDSFYKKDSQWTDGLISAAKSVAKSMSMLCETAEGVVSSKFQLEQVIVVSREVAAATIHLVSASRVKAIPLSKIQPLLEDAAGMVINETKTIVGKVESMPNFKRATLDLDDFGRLALSEQVSAPLLEANSSVLSANSGGGDGSIATQEERDLQVKILLLESTLKEAQKTYQDLQMLFKRDGQTAEADTDDLDLFSSEAYQKNIEEMNLQIKIQTLQKELSDTREKLASTRRQQYQL